jgi:hypothetical protein
MKILKNSNIDSNTDSNIESNIESNIDCNIDSHIDIDSNNNNLKNIFNEIIYKETFESARSKSIEERIGINQYGNIDSNHLTYGEVTFKSMKSIFDIIHEDSGNKNISTFCDLGSGRGASTLSAAILLQQFNLKKCIGIEILKNLYNMSLKIMKRYNASIVNNSTQLIYTNTSLFDLNTYNWKLELQKIEKDCINIVFVNSTCYSIDMMNDITNLCYDMPVDTYIVNSTKAIYSPATSHIIDFVKDVNLKTSWGTADFFIQKRIAAINNSV